MEKNIISEKIYFCNVAPMDSAVFNFNLFSLWSKRRLDWKAFHFSEAKCLSIYETESIYTFIFL